MVPLPAGSCAGIEIYLFIYLVSHEDLLCVRAALGYMGHREESTVYSLTLDDSGSGTTIHSDPQQFLRTYCVLSSGL